MCIRKLCTMFNDVAAGQFVSSAIGLRRAGRQRDTAGKCDIWERRLNANGHLPFVIDGRPTARQATAAFASKRGYKGNNRAPGGRVPPIVFLLPPHPALRTVSAEARPRPSSMMLAARYSYGAVSYTHLRAHETVL